MLPSPSFSLNETDKKIREREKISSFPPGKHPPPALSFRVSYENFPLSPLSSPPLGRARFWLDDFCPSFVPIRKIGRKRGKRGRRGGGVAPIINYSGVGPVQGRKYRLDTGERGLTTFNEVASSRYTSKGRWRGRR